MFMYVYIHIHAHTYFIKSKNLYIPEIALQQNENAQELSIYKWLIAYWMKQRHCANKEGA